MKVNLTPMKSIYIFLFIPIAMGTYNCKGSKKAAQSNTTKTEEVVQKENKATSESTANKNNSAVTDDKKLFRFTVSFISKGAGTDHQMRQKYDAFVIDFETRNKVKITINKASWGREGETDYCIEFMDIQKEIIEKFIAESKALLNTSDRINIGENTACRGVIK